MAERRREMRAGAFALVMCLSAGAASADSLYSEGAYAALVADVRAAKPGDALTVIVVETSSAAASAGAGTARSIDLAAAAEGQISNQGAGSASGSIGVASEFAGDAQIARSGRFLARVSVRVEEVLENGDLLVRGRQELHFNQEKQFISVEGQVRPVDIAPDNTVVSTRLANSKIEYKGDGILASTERKSWINRLFDWIL